MPEETLNEFNEAQEIVDKVKFELKRMIGNNCIDYGRLLAMLNGKV